jgi:hypothetical protein
VRRFVLRILIVLAVVCAGCAHEKIRHDRLLPTASQPGCFDVVLEHPLPGAYHLPGRIELRPERSTCDSAENDFVVLARDPGYRNDQRLDGHWCRRDQRWIHLIWSTHVSGVALDMEEAPVGYQGTAKTFADVEGVPSHDSAVELRRVACSHP